MTCLEVIRRKYFEGKENLANIPTNRAEFFIDLEMVVVAR
jgi:hypothetical protein